MDTLQPAQEMQFGQKQGAQTNMSKGGTSCCY
jgi:hypothetical protein